MLASCRGCSDRLMRWNFAFYLVAEVNLRVRVTSVYLANALATRMKIQIERSFTHCIRAMLACAETTFMKNENPMPIQCNYQLHMLKKCKTLCSANRRLKAFVFIKCVQSA